MTNYRIQVYIRRKGDTVLDGNEYKTEFYDDLDELLSAVAEFTNNTILEDGEREEDELPANELRSLPEYS